MKGYDEILIENYEVVCCHGVNPEEKVDPQRFWVSMRVYTDFSSAAKTDDVDQTISYSAVCKYIKSFLSENCFNLLETIATRLAEGALEKFPKAADVWVGVKKPDAPMKGVFDYVGVSVEKRWSRAYLSLGSNLGERERNLELALERIAENRKIRAIEKSGVYETEPYGGAAKGKFLNCAVALETYMKPYELLGFIQNVEEEGGRARAERWGDRTLDIDILFYENEIIGEKELAIPHPDIKNRLFVLEPLMELAPYLVHPITGKRVCEMLYDLKIK